MRRDAHGCILSAYEFLQAVNSWVYRSSYDQLDDVLRTRLHPDFPGVTTHVHVTLNFRLDQKEEYSTLVARRSVFNSSHNQGRHFVPTVILCLQPVSRLPMLSVDAPVRSTAHGTVELLSLFWGS